MNYNTLTGSAKLYKKLQSYITGQTVTAGEVPNIAIISSVDSAEHKILLDSVAFGVRKAGGVAAVHCVSGFGFFNKTNPMTAKFADSFMRTSAANGEAIIKSNLIDGIVIVTDCEITAAGLIMGAAKANCPALILPIGTGAKFCSQVLEIMGEVAGGKMNSKKSEEIIAHSAAPQSDASDLDTNTTFFVCAEAMGFCVPNASLNKMNSSAQYQAATLTGEQITANARDVLAPKKLLTKGALNNSTVLCLSVGGSISALNTVIALISIYENKIPHEYVAELSAKTGLLFSENPSCELILNAGGIMPIIKQLSATPKLIDENMLTFNGEKLKTVLPTVQPAALDSFLKTARVVIAKGSACEDGGYAQMTENTPVNFSGKAWVYLSLEDADKALLAGNIPSGSVIVVHNCAGIYVTALAYAIQGMGKQKDIAVITDGLCEKTAVLVITKCKPTSYENEAFANIQNGDTLEIDLAKGRLNTSILSKDQKMRQKKNAVRKQATYFTA